MVYTEAVGLRADWARERYNRYIDNQVELPTITVHASIYSTVGEDDKAWGVGAW